MIIKANRHNDGGKLASYMMTGSFQKEEYAELLGLKNFGEAETIFDAFRDAEIMAGGTKAQNALFHVQVRLPEQDSLTREQWEHVADRIEQRLGLEGQGRGITFHVNSRTGDRHMHIGWSLIDAETMKAIPLPYFKFRVKALSRELEEELELTRVRDERDGPIKYAATKKEQQQAQRLGVDKEQIRLTIRTAWDRSDCGRSFDNALADEGLILVTGEKRDFLVIDHAGGLHALGKKLLDVSARDVRAKLSDLDRGQIPTLQQAREFMLDLPRDRMERLTRELTEVQNQLKAEREYAQRDPVREQMAWEDAVAKAAIEKEKKLREFTEPSPQKEGPRQQEKYKPEQATDREQVAANDNQRPPELGKMQGQIRLARSLTNGPQGFANALEDRGFILARVTQDDINHKMETLREEWEKRRRDPKTWMDHAEGYDLLPDEMKKAAQRSFDQWQKRQQGKKNGQQQDKEAFTLETYVAFVQEKFAEGPKSQLARAAGGLIAVSPFGVAYQLTERNTGLERGQLEGYLRGINKAPLLSVTDAQEVIKEVQLHRDLEKFMPEWERHAPTRPVMFGNRGTHWFADAGLETTRDQRPAHLQGVSAKIWEAWTNIEFDDHAKKFYRLNAKNIPFSVATDKQAFAKALDDQGIKFARATKEEADRSHRQAEFAKAVGNYAPRFNENEILVVTEQRPEYRREGAIIVPRRLYKIDQSLAEKYVKALAKTEKLQGIDATLKASDERAQQRREYWEKVRMDRATGRRPIDPRHMAKRTGTKTIRGLKKGVAASIPAATEAVRAASTIKRGLNTVAGSLEALFVPKLTPEQIHEGEKAKVRRDAQAEETIEFTRFNAEHAQHREQREQAAARNRERERDR